MKSSLIPEKPLLVYPSLAATVGLEEAAMLSLLTDLSEHLDGATSNGFTWFTLDRDSVERAMPFWNAQDVQRVSTSLRDKGIILIASAPYGTYGQLKFAFNEKAAQPQRPAAPSAAPARHIEPAQPASAAPIAAPAQGGASKNFIPPHWQPNGDVLAQLAQHNIPEHFAREQVSEFVTYWRERAEPMRSWGSKFLRHVIHAWRNYETFQVQRDQETPMTNSWRPSEDAMDVLVRHAGINRDFIEDAIPEFILYWRERGDVMRTWNSKFIQHVRRQWLRYNSALEHDTEPRRIPADWQASEDVYDVLRLANIDLHFARELLPEFVLYWRDSNQTHVSWNTRFLQHIKHQWAKRHALNYSAATQTTTGNSKSTRDLSLEEQLTDRSWAN